MCVGKKKIYLHISEILHAFFFFLTFRKTIRLKEKDTNAKLLLRWIFFFFLTSETINWVFFSGKLQGTRATTWSFYSVWSQDAFDANSSYINIWHLSWLAAYSLPLPINHDQSHTLTQSSEHNLTPDVKVMTLYSLWLSLCCLRSKPA